MQGSNDDFLKKVVNHFFGYNRTSGFPYPFS